MVKIKIEDFFKDDNEWILSKLKNVTEDEYISDAEMAFKDDKVSTNISIVPFVRHRK